MLNLNGRKLSSTPNGWKKATVTLSFGILCTSTREAVSIRAAMDGIDDHYIAFLSILTRVTNILNAVKRQGYFILNSFFNNFSP